MLGLLKSLYLVHYSIFVRNVSAFSMRRFFATWFVLLSLVGMSQVTFDVNVSDRHLNKLEKTKSAREKLKEYKKYYKKDSVKSAKKAWKAYKKEHKDSLKVEGRWKDAKDSKRQILENKWQDQKKKYLIDTSFFAPPEDSLDWAMQELARRGDFAALQSIYEQYGQYDSSYLEHFHLDSIKLDSMEILERFQVKEKAKEYLPEELQQESDLKIDQQLQHGAIDQYGNIQRIDRSGVKDFFQNVSPKEFTTAQLSMKALKEKYLKPPNLEKDEEGIKRRSLKGTPFKNRLFLNGNITFPSTAPLVLDMNIQLGYQWNKHVSSGMGIVLREQFSNRDSSSVASNAYGYSVFSSYDVVKSFFVYAEHQGVSSQSLFGGEANAQSAWQYAHMAGVGRTFRISSKVSFSSTVLYDFNHKQNELHSRPIVFRFGYNIQF